MYSGRTTHLRCFHSLPMLHQDDAEALEALEQVSAWSSALVCFWSWLVKTTLAWPDWKWSLPNCVCFVRAHGG